MQRRFLSLLAVSLALTLAACASSPTRFYTLSPAGAGGTAAPAVNAAPLLFIEVMPVSVPERLARPQIVVRTDDARLDILEQDRWSSPFNNELHDALASAVADRLGALSVTQGRRPAGTPVYRVALELRQLDAVRGGKVEAQFGWTVTRSDSDVSTICRLTVVDAAAGTAVDGVVQALQRAVDNLAGAIATNIVNLRDGKGSACSH
jgi:uncharacterized lipoprotein YmbA